jgi:hypothetical protein
MIYLLKYLRRLMTRSHFVKLCILTGMAGGAAIASNKQLVTNDLHEVLKNAAVKQWKVTGDGETLRLQGKVTDFSVFARKAALLGEGNVRVKGQTLSFVRQGRRMELELTV